MTRRKMRSELYVRQYKYTSHKAGMCGIPSMRTRFLVLLLLTSIMAHNNQDLKGLLEYNPTQEHSAEEESAAVKLNPTLEINGLLDRLGPVIVNTDGTLARISNWHQMSEREQMVSFVLSRTLCASSPNATCCE